MSLRSGEHDAEHIVTFKVVVRCVALIEHGRADIWHISSCVALSSDVDFVVLLNVNVGLRYKAHGTLP